MAWLAPYRLHLIFLALAGASVVVISFLPPLTSGGNSGRGSRGEAVYQREYRDELAYCQANPEVADCACFARIVGSVMAHDDPRYAVGHYADSRELGRAQARGSC